MTPDALTDSKPPEVHMNMTPEQRAEALSEREALNRCVSALSDLLADPGEDRIRSRHWSAARAAVAVGHAALAQPAPSAEPVAWMDPSDPRSVLSAGDVAALGKIEPAGKACADRFTAPLYTAPPARQPLSDEQIEQIARGIPRDDLVHDFARAIERAHGIIADRGTEGADRG